MTENPPIEICLSDLRWRANELSGDEYDERLRQAANYANYYLVLLDKSLPLAPDDRGRTIAPVFTTEVAREAFVQSLTTDHLHQKLYLTLSGGQLFGSLSRMPLDGVAFNCCGPDRTIAFVPRFCEVMVENVHPSASAASSPLEAVAMAVGPLKPDFDALVRAAFPDGNVGAIPAMDALWSEAFSLKQWIVASGGGGKPLIQTYNGHSCLFVFTDQQRAMEFVRDNELSVAQDESPFLVFQMPTFLDTLQEWGAQGKYEMVHFNFGGQGWFSPAENLEPIRKRLGV